MTLNDLKETTFYLRHQHRGLAVQSIIHLYSPERQQQQVKEAPNTQQQKQTNKREKNYAQIGRTSEQ